MGVNTRRHNFGLPIPQIIRFRGRRLYSIEDQGAILEVGRSDYFSPRRPSGILFQPQFVSNAGRCQRVQSRRLPPLARMTTTSCRMWQIAIGLIRCQRSMVRETRNTPNSGDMSGIDQSRIDHAVGNRHAHTFASRNANLRLVDLGHGRLGLAHRALGMDATPRVDSLMTNRTAKPSGHRRMEVFGIHPVRPVGRKELARAGVPSGDGELERWRCP